MPEKNSTIQSSQKSSEKRTASCHHERHMSGIALKVYNFFWRMGKKTKDGSVAITNQRLAKSVGLQVSGPKVSASGKTRPVAIYLSRVKGAHVRAGWLVFLGVCKGSKSGTWTGGRYRAVSHEEWAEVKAKGLGHSPCHPQPLQIKVSDVHPGGRSLQSKKRAEGQTVAVKNGHTVCTWKDKHRLHLEGQTDQLMFLQGTFGPVGMYS